VHDAQCKANPSGLAFRTHGLPYDGLRLREIIALGESGE
jgi:hypothetical protein